jgi:hypothetical protein
MDFRAGFATAAMLLAASPAMLVAGCGSKSDTQVAGTDAESMDAPSPETAATAGLATIVYPTCSVAWDGKKVTRCGKAVFEKAMSECRSRAQIMTGEGSEVMDEWTADSWKEQAGIASTKSEEDRIKSMNSIGMPSTVETISFAVAQGTAGIQTYMCSLKDLKLEGIGKGAYSLHH